SLMGNHTGKLRISFASGLKARTHLKASDGLLTLLRLPTRVVAGTPFIHARLPNYWNPMKPEGPHLHGSRPLSSVLLLLLSVALPGGAMAQGGGIVEGRLVNKTNPSIIAAKVDLDVLAFAGGLGIIKSTTTDSSGKFRIEGLPTDQMLLIRANYKGANYFGRVNFDPTGKASLEIEIYETTTSMDGIQAEGLRMAFQFAGDHLESIETISLNNQTQPPRTFMSMGGNFRFSKAQGILEPPKISVTGPGAPMPLAQSPLESPDGQSYYSLYPLRPGVTTFEIQTALPYPNRNYTYRTKFYQDVSSVQVGVIPQDMTLSGEGLTRVQVNQQRNFAVYAGGPLKAGTEVAWTFTGGTPVAEQPESQAPGESKVKPYPTDVGQNAFIVGPLLLMGFIVVLWYSYNHVQTLSPSSELRTKELKARRDQLLSFLANLDSQYENHALDRRDYVRQREQGKRQLRRISLLLKK
ncbi:MAG TPA: carboxypeptidase-like regulatory domain-containing protein, partial [Acidobacteriota bacterium]|nr:carboxypeptidase-like regulatory domain-containing protein [Acidobacteriota bacterium]